MTRAKNDMTTQGYQAGGRGLGGGVCKGVCRVLIMRGGVAVLPGYRQVP